MARVALLLGGNQGDVKRTLQTAQQLVNSRVGAVRAALTVMKASRGDSRPRSVFRTRRWRSPPTSRRTRCSTPASGSSGNWAATAPPRRSRRPLPEPSTARGRSTSTSFSTTTKWIGDERLTVPHPLLAEREFALVPLCEIMRQRRHPVTGATVGEMLDALRNK